MKDTSDLKQIPYGISDFNEFRRSNYYYVDKTRYIVNIEKKGRYLFFIRPRRFGKSLFLSILESYYDIAFKDRFDFLFQGTEIHRNPTQEKNSYLVLKLNFSLVNPGVSLLDDSFLNYIQKSASAFLRKYEKILDFDIKKVESEFNACKSASDVLVTLLSYCRQKEQKLYVIVDDYDNFANTILSEAGEEEYQKITYSSGFLRAFFNVIKGGTTDTDAPISRLFMTGVSPITLDDVTSGFNIAENISMDSDINEIIGFTHEEVITLIEYYKQSGKIHHTTGELMQIMSQCYNHYRFSLHSPREVYNTVYILYFLKKYMKDSQIPDSLIDRNTRIDYNKLRHLIIIDKKGTPQTNGNFSHLQKIIAFGSIHSIIETGFSIEELTNPKNFISLLYYFGLLTINGIDEEKTPVLIIPNESVKQLYYDYISETYRETGIMSLDLLKYEELLKGIAFRGDWRAFIEFISQQMTASLSIRDLITGEKALQVFWNVYLGLGPFYIVYSEKEVNRGYADLALVPILIQYPTIKYSYIIEFKYIKPTRAKQIDTKRISSLKENAEDQLNRYSLDGKLKKTIGPTVLKKIVLIFRGNHLEYCGEV